MRNAPAGQEFILHDGRRLHDVNELYAALGTLPDEMFARFVTPEKHDFARWIELSLDDRFLAARARKCTTRQALRKALFTALFR